MVEGGSVLDQAIAWHLRLAAADEADWAEFVDWLEGGEANARAYDLVARQERMFDELPALQCAPLPSRVIEANDNGALPGRRWPWLAGTGAAAAATIVALAFMPIGFGNAAPITYATAAGVPRTVQLADGSSVELGGGSKLVVDPKTPRLATLVAGEGVFHVRHNANAPFTVAAGPVAVRDLGTVFSVAQDRDAVRVAVAEGSVAVSRAEQTLDLARGETATANAAGVTALVPGTIEPSAVGGWRSRTLTFQGEPLGSVVERLNRLYALDISLDPNLSDRPFTGMVQLTGEAARDVPHLAALIGTKWRRDGRTWFLSAGAATHS